MDEIELKNSVSDERYNTGQILVIDDEPLVRHALADYLADRGYQTSTSADGAEGLALARANSFDVVLVDLRMPVMGGLQVIASLHQEHPQLPLIAMSGAGVLSEAIEAMRQGAWDYITKPIQNMDEIAITIEQALEKASLINERNLYQRELEQFNRSLQEEVIRQTLDLRTQNRELIALNHVSYAISASIDLDTILNRAIDAAITAFEADGGVVRLLNPKTGMLIVATSRGLPQAYLASAQTIPLGQGIIGQVAQDGHPGIWHNTIDDPWLTHLLSPSIEENQRFGSYLCVPLRAGEEIDPANVETGKKHPIVGTLGIVTLAQRNFGAREIESLAAIGNQLGVAVTRAQYAAELQQANIELERAIAELRRLDVLREQFIQNVAHELRTPLTLVRGYIEMLASNRLDPHEQKKAASVAFQHVQKLVKLVEAITVMQELNSRPLAIELISPGELIQTVSKMIAQRAAGNGIELHVDCSPDLPNVPGDVTRLVQALHQLVDNACKFSPQGSKITLSAQLAADGDAVLISVTDHGIGIAPEEHERIFDRFYQVDGSTTRRYSGTGLGLALVKEIVQAHSGQVSVESSLGKGSTFTIALPVHNPK